MSFRRSVCYLAFLTVCADQVSIRSTAQQPARRLMRNSCCLMIASLSFLSIQHSQLLYCSTADACRLIAARSLLSSCDGWGQVFYCDQVFYLMSHGFQLMVGLLTRQYPTAAAWWLRWFTFPSSLGVQHSQLLYCLTAGTCRLIAARSLLFSCDG